MNKLLRLILVTSVSILLASLTGCAIPVNSSYGNKIDPGKVALIKKGVTTKDQIEQMFGPPMNVSLAPDGKRIMTYMYVGTQGTQSTLILPVYVSENNNSTTQTEQLQVILSKDDIVDDFEFNSGTQNTTSHGGTGGATSTTTMSN